MPLHNELVLIGLPAATVAAAGGADCKQPPAQQPHADKGTAQHEKRVHAPGGVLVAPRAPPGRGFGCIDDGAYKSGEKS